MTGLGAALGGPQVEGPPTAVPQYEFAKWLVQRKDGGADAIRIARAPSSTGPGYRKTPERKVVPGHAAAIPAHPLLQGW